MFFPSKKNLLKIRLLLLSGTIMIVLIVAIDIYSNDSHRIGSMGRRGNKASLTVQQEQLLKADELLHARLWQLQSMDQQYSSLASTQNGDEELTKSHLSIQNAEGAFQRTIDSLELVGKRYDEEAGTNDFQNMTSFFKTILDNRRFLSYLRLGVSSESKGSAGYITILKLQEELQKKDKMLAAYADNSNDEKAKIEFQNAIAEKDKQLQSLHTEIQKEKTEKQSYTQSIQKLETELSEKNKLIESVNKKLPGDQKALAGLQNEVAEKTKQIRSLESQVQKEQLEKQSYVQGVQRLQGEVAEKNKLIASLSKKSPVDQKALVNLQNDITEKNKQIRNLEALIKKEQLEKQSYVQGVQRLQSEVAEKNKLLASSNKKAPVDQKALVNLQNDITEKNKQIRNLEALIKKEQLEKQSYVQGVQKLQAEVAEKNKLIAAAGNKQSASDPKKLLDLQKDVSQKNEQIKNLQIAVQKEQSGNKTYAQTITSLQAEIIERNKIIAAANNRKIPADQKALVALQTEITEKNKRIRNLEEQLKQSVAKSQTSKPASVESSKVIQESNNLKVAYNNTLAQVNLLTRKYNALKAENDQLRSSQR
jgi:chromosome segregation ATPase